VCPYNLRVSGKRIRLADCCRVVKRGYSTQALIAPYYTGKIWYKRRRRGGGGMPKEIRNEKW